MHEDPNDAIIVRSVIDLGHNLGLQTVAEGIEDLDTWEQLMRLGCDSAQGYFLARPMPATEFAPWLRRSTAQAVVSPVRLTKRPARQPGSACRNVQPDILSETRWLARFCTGRRFLA
jgi:predicted signal transduction protein with EAL and GGDEF domain